MCRRLAERSLAGARDCKPFSIMTASRKTPIAQSINGGKLIENMSAAFIRLPQPWILLLGLTVALTACKVSNKNHSPAMPPQKAITRKVDLRRFMGDWYVIAHIPTFIEKEAYNALERYELKEDGTIATTFTFNKGSLDGPLKTYHPTGFVHDSTTNAEWRMQFVWPFKAAYLITRLDDDYQTTVVGVPDRSYAWIMARSKSLPDAKYNELVGFLKNSGHDISKLRRVPQGK